jgi:hypothetical protein
VPENRPDLGEFFSVQWTRTRLCRLLRDYFLHGRPAAAAATGTDSLGPVRVGTDLTFYYDPADRLGRVTPDLYVMEGIGYDEQLRSFRVYERGVGPELVLHIVDTPLSPEDGLLMHFLRLGVRDVVLYDPLWWMQPANAPKSRRLLWHYRRSPSENGSGPTSEVMRLLPQEHPGRIYLSRYKLWLIHRGGADLRIYSAAAAAEPQDAAAGQQWMSPPPESALWPLPEERLAPQP